MTRPTVVLALLGLAACRAGSAPPAPPGPLPPGDRPVAIAPSGRDTTCELAPGSPGAERPGTLSVALPGPVDAGHAPVPGSEAERLVFAQLYEPLIRIDCADRVTPALADRWTADSGGRRWTLTLRDDARFWDGEPVSARDVIAGWRARGDAAPLGRTAAAPSEREIRVTVAGPAALRALADPAYAVTKRSPDGGWPIGTGSYWTTGPGSTAAGALLLQPVAAGTLPALAVRDVSAADPRDVLDQAVDLLITGDPAVVGYAGTRPELVTLPLTWSRRYVLVGPAADSGATAHLDRADLARAVHAEARPDSGAVCLPLDSVATGGQPVLPLRRVIYDRSDATARELAERIVARGPLGHDVPAAGLAPAEFTAALRHAWAAIIVDQRSAPCEADGDGGPARALIVTRPYAVVRRGGPRLLLDADGTLRVAPPSPSR